VPGLGTSFGRGGATTALQDLAHADAILIMGSSMAEQHPVGFRFVIQARERGAAILHVDPRFTRTSAMADVWVPIRAGSDLVFLGALINYVLQQERDFREYVLHYTNAATIIRDDFRDTEDLGGLFSGWNEDEQKYTTDSWLYEGTNAAGAASGETASTAHGLWGKGRGGQPSLLLGAPRDETLKHPRCVYQLLKRHFARYTPELVECLCGTPRDQFLRIADQYSAASGPEKTGAICYSVGWTQHSTGAQMIRAAAILQQLLGNIGRPGGGIMALRGHASIQGSTDIPTLYDVLPGYLPMPNFEAGTHTLQDYIRQNGTHAGWWHNVDKYIISLLKAWYGNRATATNDYGYDWLPRITGDHSHQGYWLDMADGRMEGLFVLGQNPAVGAPNSRLERRALANLDWLVVRDLVEIETASFWYDSPEVDRGELRPDEIKTEVFLMPAASHVEKEGSFTNTQRLLQWREKAIAPPGDARSETWFLYHLGRRLKDRARTDTTPRNAGLRALTWDYRVRGPLMEPAAEDILGEINGRYVADRALVSGFRDLKADGSTECGCWIYSGVHPEPGRNRANERQSHDFLGHGWGFAWPADRRIMYNRASARPDGTPWSERKKLVWWDGAKREWTGFDVPDFTTTKPPDYRPYDGAEGDDALAGDAPFIMHADGVGWIWVPIGLRDGPLPTHYEPLESPVCNALYPDRATNPPADKKVRPDNDYVAASDPRFPHVLTTYRLTEHHTAGGMSRYISHLAELQPEFFAEISPELASIVGVRNGGWLTVASPRGLVEARALITTRLPPLRVDGRVIHQVGLPYHWGTRGLVTGDSANDLVAISEEPNVRIMETKGLVCHVAAGRRPRGPAALEYLDALLQGEHRADNRFSH
jgi:formate dehydrogenase major subunit